MSNIKAKIGQIWNCHGSKIMTGLGIAGSAVALGIVAYKSITKAPKIIEDTKKDLEEVRAKEVTEEYTEKQKGKEIAKSYIRGGMAFAKLYGVAFIIEAASIGLIVGSDVKDCKRNAYLTSSLVAAEKTIDTIKNNTIERFGEDVYYDLEHGIRKQEITEDETDPETGKKKKVKKTVEVADPNKSGCYTKYFTKSNPYWDEVSGYDHKMNDDYLEMFFRSNESTLTTRLRAKKNSIKDPFVNLNDAFELYGFERETYAYAPCWKYEEGKCTCVDISWKKVHLKNEDNRFEEAYAIDFRPVFNSQSGELL